MKVTATKWEDIDVEVSEEQIEILMCELLKQDWNEHKDAFGMEMPELLEAISIVYEAYSGKPIDYLGRLDG
jgi:hypothetical protein